MELVWFADASDLQKLMELVQFAGVKPADGGGTGVACGRKSCKCETAARSILSV